MDSYKGSRTGGNISKIVDMELVFAENANLTASGVIGTPVEVGTGFVECDVVIDAHANTGENTVQIEGSYVADFATKVTLASVSVADGFSGRKIIAIRNAYANETPYPYIRAYGTLATAGPMLVTAFLAKK